MTKTAADDIVTRFIFGQCWFQFFIGGVFYSLSPLALPISNAFMENGGDPAFDGGIVFYGFAVLMVVQSLAICVVIFRIDNGPFRQKKLAVTASYLSWPIGFALMALSVQLKSRWLLLAGAFPCLGVAIGVQIGYMHLVVTSVVYGRNVIKGAALSGGACAVGALSWNIVFGEVINSLGFKHLVTALWIFFSLHAFGVAVGVFFLNPARYIPSAPVPAANSENRMPATSKGLTVRQALRDWRVILFVFIVESFFFAGLTMKTLMSELFEKLLKMSYIDAVRYSDGCLAAYVVARFASPFLAFGDKVFVLFAVVLTLEGIAYALTPWAVGLDVGTAPIYTSFRVVGGTAFAILKSNTSVLLIRIFGPENVAPISGIFLATESLVGLGPSLAFSLHMQQVNAGSSSEHSYDVFFYVCAALVLTSSAGVVVLRQTMPKDIGHSHKEAEVPRSQDFQQAVEPTEDGDEIKTAGLAGT